MLVYGRSILVYGTLVNTQVGYMAPHLGEWNTSEYVHEHGVGVGTW